MSVLEQEKSAALWTITAILSYIANLNIIIITLLTIQAIISIIASIILSYKHYGTQKPKTRQRGRSRSR